MAHKNVIIRLFIFIIGFISASAQVAPTPDIRFLFDGGSYTGTTSGSTIVYTSITGSVPFNTNRCNVSNSAITFDGSQNNNLYVNTLPGVPEMEPNSELTISAWIIPFDLTDCKIVSKFASNSPTTGYSIAVKQNGVFAEVYDRTGAQTNFNTKDVGVFVNTGEWFHVAYTYKAFDSLKIYINGKFIGGTPAADVFGVMTNAGLTFGRAVFDNQFATSTSGLFLFNGAIDEVRIFKTALNKSQILSTYLSTTITSLFSMPLCPTNTQTFQVGTNTGWTYQWYKGTGSSIGSSINASTNGGIYGYTFTNSGLDLSSLPYSISGSVFRNVISNVCSGAPAAGFTGQLTTSGIALSVNPPTSIVSEILTKNTCFLISTTINSSATGLNLSYQWLKNGVAINASTEAGNYGTSFSTPGLNIALPIINGVTYQNIITGSCGVVTTTGTLLTVSNNITTFSGPSAYTGCVGDNVSFDVSATGSNLKYRWLKNGTFITAGTDGGSYGYTFSTTSLNLTVPSGLVGNTIYVCSISGDCGSPVTLGGANLTIRPTTSITGPLLSNNYCSGGNTIIGINTIAGYNLSIVWGEDGNILSNGGSISGANTRNLSLNGIPSNYPGTYQATVTGACGTVVSSSASLNNLPTTQILGINPSIATVCSGSSTSMSITVIGSNVTFSWYRSSTSGGAANTLVTDGVYNPPGPGDITFSNSNSTILGLGTIGDALNGFNIRATASGVCGTFSTSNSTINVQNSPSYGNPTSVTTCSGTPVTFNIVTPSGTNLTYQWYRGATTLTGSAITSSTDGGIYSNTYSTSSLNLSTPPLSLSGYYFWCDVGSACGNLVSGAAQLTYYSPPTMSIQPPSSLATCSGLNIRISASANGTPTPNYQWQLFNGSSWTNVSNGTNYSGSQNQNFTVVGIPTSFSGNNYRVQAYNACGTVTSFVTTVQTNIRPSVYLNGLKNKYCGNDLSDTIQAFTSLPFAGGSFTMSPLIQTLTPYSTDKAILSNFNYYGSITTVNVAYISLNDAKGCNNTATGTFIVYPASQFLFGMNFIYPTVTSFLNNGAPETILATVSSSFNGTKSYSGPGVNGNKFYPASFTTQTYSIPINFTFTESVSGCSVTISKFLNVVTPDNIVVQFTGSGATLNGTYYAFCASDGANYDMKLTSNYDILYNNPNPTVTGTPNYCRTMTGYVDPYSGSAYTITGPVYGSGITGTFGDITSFKFNPSVAGVGSHYLVPTYSQNQIPTTAPGLCNSQKYYYTISNYQYVYVNPKPATPYPYYPIVNSFVGICQGNINNFGQINFTNSYNIEWSNGTISSVSGVISSLNGVSNPDVSQLINTTVAGDYYFYCRQQYNGCYSDYYKFRITISRKPQSPYQTNTSDVCEKSSTYLLSTTDVGNNFYWYSSTTQPAFINTGNINSYNLPISSFNPGVYNYFARKDSGNCLSDFGSFTFKINPLPSAPIVNPVYSGCVTSPFSSTPGVVLTMTGTFTGLYFQWYKRATLFFVPIGTTTGTLLGSNLQSTFNEPSLASVAGTNQYQVQAINTVTGCIGNRTNYRIDLFNIPSPPAVKTLLTLCNNDTFPQLGIQNISLFATYKWYFNNTIGGSVLSVNPFFNTSPFIPLSAKNKYLDTTFYVSETKNGCESATSPANFKMFGPFPSLTINGLNTLASINLSQEASRYCTGANRQIQAIAQIGNNLSIDGINWIYASTTSSGYLFSYPLISTAGVVSSYYQLIRKVPNSSNQCLSSLIGFNFTINPTPSIPVTRDTAYCVPSFTSLPLGPVIANTTFSGSVPIFRWYPNKNNNSIFSSGNVVTSSPNLVQLSYTPPINYSFTGVLISDFYNFYVTQEINGCESPLVDQAAARLNVYRTPFAPNTSQNFLAICSGVPMPSFTAAFPLGSNALWYNTSPTTIVGQVPNLSTGGVFFPPVSNSVSGFVLSAPGIAYPFYVAIRAYGQTTSSINFIGCEGPASVVTVVVKSIPPKPSSDSLKTFCAGSQVLPLQMASVPGFSNTWYANITQVGILGQGQNGRVYQTGLNSNVTNVVSNYFYVTQTYNQCEGPPSTFQIDLRPNPILTFTGLTSQYCQYADPVTLTGFSITGGNLGGNYYGDANMPLNAISNIGTNSGTALFIPRNASKAVTADYFVFYTYSDIYNCSNTISGTVRVNPKPLIQINTVFDSVYCKYSNFSVALSGNQANGQFYLNDPSLPGNLPITQFVPLNAPYGRDSIIYTFTDANNCVNDTSVHFNVYPVPIPNFSFSSRCVTDSIKFSDASTISITGVTTDFIKSFKWTINNQVITTASPIAVFNQFGLTDIKLNTTSNHGCQQSITKSVFIGSYPIVDFKWNNICNGDITSFINKSTINLGQTISGYSWDFGIADINSDTSNLFQPTFKYDNIGSYKVKLRAISNVGCITKDSSTLNTLPTVTTFPYIQDFESNSGAWFVDNQSQNATWQYGSPTKNLFNSSNSTNKVWATGLNPGNRNPERSYLNGPCFNLNSLNKPMFSFDIAYNNQQIDGAVVQYSTDGGNVWKPVGDFNTGIQWCNAQNLISDPGDQLSYRQVYDPNNLLPNAQQIGWNGTTAGWVNARNILDDAINPNANTRIRIAFASYNASSLDGVALDNITIAERTRVALIENFTNINDSLSNKYYATTDSLINKNKKDAVAIQYHSSFPAADPFNKANPSDPGARMLFYSFSSVPRAALDGAVVPGTSRNLTQNMIYKEALEIPDFYIKNVQYKNASNLFEVSADFVANKSISSNSNGTKRELIVNFGIIEKEINGIVTSSYGKTKFINVAKKLLPDAGGKSIFRDWNPGDKETVKQTWQYTNADLFDTKTNQLGVVIFIQDRATNKIMQASYFGPQMSNAVTITGAINSILSKTLPDVIIYPNPANDDLHIMLTDIQTESIQWHLLSQTGNSIASGLIEAQEQGVTISTNNIPSGIYILKLGGLVRKVVIQH
ncbi:MAG: LamG-like jellyroll fold domain-containing protein [Bacteroidota bacterium]|nr:LamG-like jellyroll fold domain-containing protein [Bacteroidota bacterium]